MQHTQTLPDQTKHASTHPIHTHVVHGSWTMKSLLKKAFMRTWSRLLSILLSTLLTMLVTCGVLLVSALLIGIPLFALSAASQYGIAVLIGAIGLIGIIAATTYVSVWGQLATVHLITNESPHDVIGAWRHVRPHIKRAFVAFITMVLFLIGLVPLSFISLFIPLTIWNFLFGFTLFIIISTHKSASDALWSSKDMILAKFWGIAGRTVLLWIFLLFTSFCIHLILTHFMNESQHTGNTSSVLSDLLNLAFEFFVAQYTFAFMYEMYKLMPVPHTSKTPHKWIVVSAIGIVVMLIGTVSLISYAATVNWKEVQHKFSVEHQKEKHQNDTKGFEQSNHKQYQNQ